jgi:hypothetical protein
VLFNLVVIDLLICHPWSFRSTHTVGVLSFTMENAIRFYTVLT